VGNSLHLGILGCYIRVLSNTFFVNETFSDYVSNMHNLHFKLKHKIDEDEFVELLKDNMNSRMGGLLLTSPLTSLAEFKKEGLRVDRWLKNTAKNMPSTTKLF